jgi:hypothetical protein
LYLQGDFISRKGHLMEFYRELAQNDYIKIDSIPHVLRNEPQIIELFEAYGMENVLPIRSRSEHTYNVFKKPAIKVITVHETKYIRQFLQYHYDMKENYGVRLHELDKKDLFEKFRFAFPSNGLVNFSDEYGNVLYPYQYSIPKEKFPANFPYLICNGFHSQWYHVFLKDGTPLDSAYYEKIKLVDSTTYYGIVCMRGWLEDEENSVIYDVMRCYYDFEIQEFVKEETQLKESGFVDDENEDENLN